MAYPTYTPIGRYVDFSPSTFIIPKMYWDAFSLEQRYHALCKTLSRLITYADMLGIQSDELGVLYETLANDFQTFKESGFDDYYRDQIEQWVNNNLETLYHLLVKQVYFGLTLDGHFVAYIPDSWNDIIFDTGFNYDLDTYGRLILSFNVDDPAEAVDQTPDENSEGVNP